MAYELAPFEGWPKLSRLVRDVVITEKLDGTNAQVFVPEDEASPLQFGSRTRWLSVASDNYGFCRWGTENEAMLRALLGPGRHFGEWYGVGINRGYSLRERRLALFNSDRWEALNSYPDVNRNGIYCVPVLARGPLCDATIDQAVRQLIEGGSIAAPGYRNPEGIVVFHTASRVMYKWTFGGDGNKLTPVDKDGNHVQ